MSIKAERRAYVPFMPTFISGNQTEQNRIAFKALDSHYFYSPARFVALQKKREKEGDHYGLCISLVRAQQKYALQPGHDQGLLLPCLLPTSQVRLPVSLCLSSSLKRSHNLLLQLWQQVMELPSSCCSS